MSLKDLISKKLSTHIEGGLSAFAAYAFALPYYLILIFVLCLFGEIDFVFSVYFLKLVLARSLTDAVGKWFKMSSYKYGDISLVTIIYGLQPLFIILFSILILNQIPTTLATIGILIIVIGTLVLSLEKQVSFEELKNKKKAIILALLSTVFLSCNSVFDSLASKEAGAVWSAFSMTALATLFLLPISLKKKNIAPLQLNKFNLSLRGFFEVLAMVSKLTALQYLEVAYVAGLQKLSILFSITGGYFLYNEKGFKIRFIAGILITIGAALILIGR